MLTIPAFIPLPEAVRKYGLDEALIRALVERGRIKAAMIDDQIFIPVSAAQAQVPQPQQAPTTRKEDLPEYKKHAHLKGVPTWILKAAEDYKVPFSTMRGWVQKGYISILGQDGKKILLDEQDVAYCADVYNRRRGQGKWLFDENGLPYKPKTGSLAI